MPYDEKIAELSKQKNKRIAKLKALEYAVILENGFRRINVKRIIKNAIEFEKYLLSD